MAFSQLVFILGQPPSIEMLPVCVFKNEGYMCSRPHVVPICLVNLVKCFSDSMDNGLLVLPSAKKSDVVGKLVYHADGVN